MNAKQLLIERFGYPSFRPGQKEIIDALLVGESVLGMLPTGTGKSLCYQLPGYLFEGTVIVISPLISLMEDQVTQLQQLGERKTVALNSLLSMSEKQYVLEHLSTYKFIFMSPEMFLSDKTQQALERIKIAFIVVDEAHCVSQWGVDFRPEYLKLSEGIRFLNQSLILALTATATPEVRQDIQQLLFSQTVKEIVYSVDRPNISLFVETGEKQERLLELLPKLSGAGIIYCATRKHVEELYERLKKRERIAYYHGGLTGQERRMLQQQFIAGELRILIATNAFGMGVNKNDIRFVIHYDLPSSPEDYLQEIGRAGRDGQFSQAILLYNEGDEYIHQFLHQQSVDSRRLFEIKKQTADLVLDNPLIQKWEKLFPNQSQELIDLLEQREKIRKIQLQEMLTYIQLTGCRRKYLVNYFGQQLGNQPKDCCDNDGASIKTAEESPEPIIFSEEWSVILLKLFKKTMKD
ncbi:RecQ family ATP-dependent DNA helicase [Enterococcus sp. AZ072]|uniref:RecQ family ATP-dependent DNA helicase n=1 Tax=unclassified Enterococcus TaxID=2608891 RepID=UPI003D280D0E